MNAPLSLTMPHTIAPELLEEYPDLAKISFEIVEVWPKMAREWLDKFNRNNRNQSAKTKYRYTAIMAAFGWQLNGETICFDWDGFLLNGQHRLESCAAGEAPFITVVIRGLNPKVVTTYDGGLKRKARDVLTMNGFKTTQTASVAQVLMDYRDLSLHANRATLRADFEHYQILTFCKQNTQLDKLVGDNHAHMSRWKNHFVPAVSLAFLYLATHSGHTTANAKAYLHKLQVWQVGDDANLGATLAALERHGRTSRIYALLLAELVSGFNTSLGNSPPKHPLKIGYPAIIKAQASPPT